MNSALNNDHELARLLSDGHFEEVENAAASRLAANPSDSVAWSIIGLASSQQGDLGAAETAFRCVVGLSPSSSVGWHELAKVLVLKEQFQGALEASIKAVELDPDDGELLSFLCSVVYKLNEDKSSNEALQLLNNLLTKNPKSRLLHASMAKLYQHAGSFEKATTSMVLALGCCSKKERPVFLKALGLFLFDIGKFNEASKAFAEMTELEPDNPKGWVGFGACFQEIQDFSIACEAYERALEIDPRDEAARKNLAICYSRLNRYRDAIELLEPFLDIGDGALSLDKLDDLSGVWAQYNFYKRHLADWSVHKTDEAFYSYFADERADFSVSNPSPFHIMPLIDSPKVNLALSKAFGRTEPPQREFSNRKNDSSKIKVGWFGSDFHDHATMFLLAGLFREYDRENFSFHIYSYGPNLLSSYRQSLIKNVDQFYDLAAFNDEKIIDLAVADSLDIAIDLKGYTGGGRTNLFASRLAPIQVQFLGYPGSSGKDYFDYLIADRTLVPEFLREHYTEKILFMPVTYQPNDSLRKRAEGSQNRSRWGLPENAIVFNAFNQIYKVSSKEFDIWMRLLAEVESSVLWLLSSEEEVKKNLRKSASAYGIEPDRLIFSGAVGVDEHLARLSCADLYLDCFAVNGHTSISDALFAGLPVVTKAGSQFAARVGSSLVSAAGMGELVAGTEDEYFNIAKSLATDKGLRNRFNAILQRIHEPNGLYDSEAYTRSFERGLFAVQELRENGLGPTDIESIH